MKIEPPRNQSANQWHSSKSKRYNAAINRTIYRWFTLGLPGTFFWKKSSWPFVIFVIIVPEIKVLPFDEHVFCI